MFGDKRYVINLPSREDRRIECIKHANKYDFDFEFVNGIDSSSLDLKQLLDDELISPTFLDPHGTCCTKGTYGCSLGHINAWKKALEDGVETALFLEDDFFVSPFVDYDLMVNKNYNFIMDVDWDILFLGKHKQFVTGEKINNLMVRTTEDWLDIPLEKRDDKNGLEFWGAHAYLVRKKTIQFLLDNYIPVNMGVDVWLQYHTKQKDINIYTLKETLIWQRSSLIMMNMQRDLSGQEIMEMTDSDTFANINRAGKLKWIQFPDFSTDLNKGDLMWEFNITGDNQND